MIVKGSAQINVFIIFLLQTTMTASEIDFILIYVPRNVNQFEKLKQVIY